MWPYTDTEYNWLEPASDNPYGPPKGPDLSPQAVEFYMRRGRKLRAEAAAEIWAGMGRGIARGVSGLWHAVTDRSRVAHHH